MSKTKMTPAQVAEKIAKFIAKQETTLKRYPVGPLANAARLNLKKGQEALAQLQETNEGMRVGQQDPAQMGAPMPNDMNYMQARYGGFTVPKYDAGGGTGSPYQLGLRNLNPGNIRSWGDRPVVDGFAQFDTLEAGWEALQKQLQKYQGFRGEPSKSGVTGESTLAEAMGKYAPHFENDTDGYINRLVDYLTRGGLDINADTPISEIPTEEWASAISLVESPEAYAALESAGYLSENISSALAGDTAVVNARSVVEPYLSEFPDSFNIAPSQGNIEDSTDVDVANVPAGQQPDVSASEAASSTRVIQQDESDLLAQADASGNAIADPNAIGSTWERGIGAETWRIEGRGFGGIKNEASSELYESDLNFKGSRAKTENGAIPFNETTDGRYVYAKNEWGDYNVYDNLSKQYSVLREENIDSSGENLNTTSAWTNALTADGIPFNYKIDGDVAEGDFGRMFQYDNFGMQTIPHDEDGKQMETDRHNIMATSVGHRQGTAWGHNFSLDDAIKGNLTAMGLEEPSWKETNLDRPMWGTDREDWTPEQEASVADTERRQALWDEAYEQEALKAYTNPGSYEFTVTPEQNKTWGENIFEGALDWAIGGTADSLLGRSLGWDKSWDKVQERDAEPESYQYRGVGGFTSHSDYVSGEMYANATTDEERQEALEYTNHFQLTRQTDNLFGNMMNPAGLMVLRGKVAQAASKALLKQPKTLTGLRNIRNLKPTSLTRGSNTVTGNALANQIATKTGSAVDDVIKLTDDLAKVGDDILHPGGTSPGGTPTNTYVPNARPWAPIRDPVTGQFRGSTKGLADAWRTGTPLGESTLGVADDFATTMGQGVDDFFSPSLGARVGGKNLVRPGYYPGTNIPKASNLPAVTGKNLPAVSGSNLPLSMRGNLPALRPNLPGVIPRGNLPAINIPSLGTGLTRRAGQFGAQGWTGLGRAATVHGLNVRDDDEVRIPKPDSVEGEKTDGVTTPDTTEKVDGLLEGLEGIETPGYVPDTKDWDTKGPDTYNLDMGKPSALMAIPGLAALASGRIQGRALDNMRGPTAPITTPMHKFNYKSNIGQQLQEVKDASNAVMQNTNLQGQQQAALNQQLMAQRLKSNSGLLQQDAQQEQAAQAQYDAMATQSRMMNNNLRNQYLQDSTNFKNKKEMLQASVKQQPLNVLASSAQDYLTNVYQKNLAAQLEAIGRPYKTGYEEDDEKE
jgi:hypothetical protein